jgi:phospholipase/lecithinase/hemolysin
LKLFLQELYSLDVRRIGVINLPPLGCLPFEKTLRIKVGGECAEEVNEAAAEYNAKLISTMDGLKPKLPGLKIVSLNYYDIVLSAIKDPAKYGIVKLYLSLCCNLHVSLLV